MPRHTEVMTIDVQNAFCRLQSAFVRQYGQDVAHFLGLFNTITSRVERLSKFVELIVVSLKKQSTNDFTQPPLFQSALNNFEGRQFSFVKETDDVCELGELPAFSRERES